MAENNAVVRVYDPDAEARATINDLQRSGFAMNKLSIVGKDYHTAGGVIGYHNVADRMKVWGELGISWGGLSGLLMGSAFYFIPGIGPVIVFGPLVGWIIRAVKGAVMTSELSALGAGLHSVGIPKHSIMEYETALKSDKFIVIAHGTPDDLANARSVLETPVPAQIAPVLRGITRPARVNSPRRHREVRNWQDTMSTTHSTTYRRLAGQPVSARRAASYERTATASVLPEQFFDSRVKLAAVRPETALMYAVLEDAFLCFHKQFETEPRFIERAREAQDWFFSDDSRWLFSYLSVCHALGLEPHYIRKKLKHWAPSRLDLAPATR